jgi:autophagy-related protein 2
MRFRLHDTSVTVLLFEGYDWQRTRKAIEDEIKLVRRRLEKIRQLLASGQTADESIENTRSVLFNSIYIGLDQSRELDPAALLAAIDEELGDLGNDTSSVSSWQTDFPAGHPNHHSTAQRGQNRKTRLKGKRLTRSKKAQMEIDLEAIRLDYDAFAKDSPKSSRLHVTVGSMEILDHIKTSTWKKFLTEMKADSRGNVRETDADMVRVELTGVRPSLPSLEEEFRLRVCRKRSK